LLEDEYFYRPTDPEEEAAFEAELERGAVAGMAAAAATPVATLDDFQRQLDFGAARGMTASLEDDYTVFLEPIEQAPLDEQLAGEYEGIGVWVEHPEGRFTIVAPSPARRPKRRGCGAAT
jgi:C-terminal processing protease CtpA/Prc